MPEKPEIEKLKVLHDLNGNFQVSDEMRTALHSQLTEDSREKIARFVDGFKIEDWFEWIFCQMPWVQLIHGLDQQQFPRWSKEKYQVPDFLILVETSSLAHQPLLVEVKRVSGEKKTLELQDSQVLLCERYASAVNIPLVFAVYWEFLNAWTVNTVDSFEIKSSTRKLALTTAFELDFSAILGDISYFLPYPIRRESRFTKREVDDECVKHAKYGRLIVDTATLGKRRVDLAGVESAVIDSMLEMKLQTVRDLGNDETELIEITDETDVLKLSAWMMRHLGLFGVAPSEENAAQSIRIITELMKKLECTILHPFPTPRTGDLKRVDSLFRR